MFMILLSLVLLKVNRILINKTDEEAVCTFGEEERYDVFLLGSSHMYRGISPMILWEKYGITSYNLGSSEQLIPQSYWMLRYALEKAAKPRLVVLETCMADVKDRKIISPARLHANFDSLSRNKVWYQAISDLDPGNEINYILPLITYHSRWTELTKKDFTSSQYYTQGFLSYYKIKKFDDVNWNKADKDYEISDLVLRYLEMIIQLCEDEGIELLFVDSPAVEITAQTQQISEYLQENPRNLRYSFLSCNTEEAWEEMGVSLEKDFSDKEHVNYAGAVKYTEWLGEYLWENYDLEDCRGKIQWGDYSGYKKEISTYLESAYSLGALSDEGKEYLQKALDKDFAEKQ